MPLEIQNKKMAMVLCMDWPLELRASLRWEPREPIRFSWHCNGHGRTFGEVFCRNTPNTACKKLLINLTKKLNGSAPGAMHGSPHGTEWAAS